MPANADKNLGIDPKYLSMPIIFGILIGIDRRSVIHGVLILVAKSRVNNNKSKQIVRNTVFVRFCNF